MRRGSDPDVAGFRRANWWAPRLLRDRHAAGGPATRTDGGEPQNERAPELISAG